jgi:outer membrane protein OmpA-like peptidoglycan-associated protein
MSTTRSSALLVMIVVVLASACGPKRIAHPAPPVPPSLIVLLPDPETGVTGRVIISNSFAATDLAAPRASTRVTADGPPGPVTTMSDADVTRLFGAALAALPPAPRHFTLQFRFESDALTDESAALVPEILSTVKGLAFPEVIVIGHTDTMGDLAANLALGLRRANSVRDILVQAGLAQSIVDVTSHGEADPLVKTPDNTPEPRNRRVEITVR